MLAMVSGSVAFAPNPADGADLHLRALAAAGADDRQEHRLARLAAGQRDPLRDRRGAALLGRVLLAGRLGGAAGDAQIRGDRLMESSVATPPAGRRRRRPRPPKPARTRSRAAPPGSLSDRIGLAICWALGLLFCAIAVAIVVYLLIQGLKYLRPSMLVTPATAGFSQSQTRRLLRRPDRHPDRRHDGDRDRAAGRRRRSRSGWSSTAARRRLARITESTIEAIAGIPSIVLALFGTVIFSSTALGFLSRTSEGVVFGRSFFAAAAMLSLVALPLVVASTREGLNAIPQHVREASYAVGKTKIATTRRILLPAARPQVATGAMLGLGRIIGDTAIIVVLLGATQNFAPVEQRLPAQLPARGGHDPDQLRLRGLPDREPQPAPEGLRGGLRPAADGAGPERGRRRRPSPRPKGRNVES